MADVAILFSGGRDSTLSAVKSRRAGDYLHLLSIRSGFGYNTSLCDIRIQELEAAWGGSAFTWKVLNAHGLVRRICLADLVDDIRQDDCQLVLLGEALAAFALGIRYCLERGITILAFGAAGYQGNYPEQQQRSVEFFTELCAEYGVRLSLPMIDARSELEVRLALLDEGLSPKSLEGSTMFADLEDNPPAPTVSRYLQRKKPIVVDFLARSVVSFE